MLSQLLMSKQEKALITMAVLIMPKKMSLTAIVGSGTGPALMPSSMAMTPKLLGSTITAIPSVRTGIIAAGEQPLSIQERSLRVRLQHEVAPWMRTRIEAGLLME
jgi:hypothetical protein